MNRRHFLTTIGTLAPAATAGCQSFQSLLPSSVSGEWDGGTYVVEFEGDTQIRGWAVESPGGDFIASGNKDPIDDTLRIDLYAESPLRSGTYTFRAMSEEVEMFAVTERDWDVTYQIDLEPTVSFTPTFDADELTFEVEVTNDGDCPIVPTELRVSGESGEAQTELSGSIIPPGESDTIQSDGLPFYRDGNGCYQIHPTVQATLVTNPVDGFEIEWDTGYDSTEEICVSTISL